MSFRPVDPLRGAPEHASLPRARRGRAGRLIASLLAAACSIAAVPALAQIDSSVLIVPAFPDNFRRDRNVSVLEEPRPDYDPLGIHTHSFLVHPRLELDGGATDNVYLTSANDIGAAILSVSPSVRADSEWGRDAVSLYAAGTFNGYVGQSRRNETLYDFRSLGRKDIGSDYSLTAEAQYAKLYDSPATGGIDPALSVLSSYRRSFFSLRGQYEAGRGRATLALDRTAFSFEPIDFGNNNVVSQADRDRVISRVTGEVQYALSPSVSVYGQGTYNTIDYSRSLPNGVSNRDSVGERIVAGLNFDLAGLARGKIGVGFINRDFHSPLYQNVSGLSVEAEVDYFLSPLTTITLLLGRTLGDADVFSVSAYFDNEVSLQVDHELLRNLIVNVAADYRQQDYIGRNDESTYVQVSTGARYLSSRFLSVVGKVNYLRRSSDGLFGNGLSELRGQVGVILQR